MPISELRKRKDELCVQGDANLERAARALPAGQLVIYGAGEAGVKMKQLLQKYGRSTDFFADSLKTESVDGTPLILLANIPTLDNPVVVIAAWDRETIVNQLTAAGVKNIEANLYNMLNGLAARDSFAAHFAELEKVEAMLADERSKETLRALIQQTMTLEQSLIEKAFTPGQYFFGEPFLLKANDVFVDVGAFNGDTVQDIYARFGTNLGAVHCFEPNETNFKALLEVIAKNGLEGKVIPHNQGLSNRHEKVSFAGFGSGFHKSDSETAEVCELVAFDEAYADIKPDVVKMDIEGAEPVALKGMAKTIQQHKPRLSICVYHEPQHFWEIPLYAQSLVPEYKFSLRHHTHTRLETVMYAIV